MSKRFNFQRLFLLMSAAGMIGISSNAMAAAFQLWEQDGASIGNYHAGRAAEAPDASTAYYNPAGLIRIHNQQAVFALDPILTDFKFNGTVEVITAGLGSAGPVAGTAQGGNLNFLPSLNYAAPLSDRVVFGFSVVSPFGLETNYGTSSFVRYAATLTSLQVIDIAPSLGIALNDKLSVGFGADIERARGEFDLVGGIPLLNEFANYDTPSKNVGYGWGYGYHLGALYQFNEQTRVGLAYHSKVVHHLSGTSKFNGPLANDLTGGLQESTNLEANSTLPATTTLSLFHTLNPTWDVMGTVAYTQWSEFSQLVLQNTAALVDGMSSNSVNVVIPEHYRNTWNYSVGTNYHASEEWMFRGGVGYDETPSSNRYRNLQLPDSDRIAVALGTHYQATKTLGFDAGWTHFFVMNSRINVSQAFGDQTTVTNGTTNASADVFGFQAKWDIT
jgi:long-chain fatty acid transport protein